MAEIHIAGRPAYRIYQWLWTGLDWLLPPHCGGCGKQGTRWCASCQLETATINPPICDRCGSPQQAEGICTRCDEFPPYYSALRSWASFSGPLRNSIHRLKYYHDIALGDMLAWPLINYIKNIGWGIDVVVPVPISLSRKAARGYNQAALLARPIALRFGLKYSPRALIKTRETRSQVGLTLEERRANVHGAFKSNHRIVAGKRVLVVDDVITSGATLNACAQALRIVEAMEVYCLTLARAL